MPVVWRLTLPAFARKLDGEGNRRHGARWNSPGRGVVYTSATLSLAVLETLAHLPLELRANLPRMSATAIHLPDVEMDAVTSREMQRHRSDLTSWCRARGDDWLTSARHLVLSAPSLIVPQERNFMINPAHPDMAKISIARVEDFRFDTRLISGQAPH
jgi:RES domain-containing protein